MKEYQEKISRRNFIEKIAVASTVMAFIPHRTLSSEIDAWFNISLAQWSLHRTLSEGKLKHLDFPEFSKKHFEINAVEYVSTFFPDTGLSKQYLSQLKLRCNDNGIDSLLIMIDQQGDFGLTDESAIEKTLQNHYKWVEAAQFLGCHSIRVNARGNGTKEDVGKAVVDSLYRLGEFSQDYGINILVENHGGYSSDGEWLSKVIKTVDLPNVGTLPDFGNFKINKKTGEEYDKYLGVDQLMPFAKAVSAKCLDFDEHGETTIDYDRMLNILKIHGYNGYVGIEYTGKRLSEIEGIKACKNILVKLNS